MQMCEFAIFSSGPICISLTVDWRERKKKGNNNGLAGWLVSGRRPTNQLSGSSAEQNEAERAVRRCQSSLALNSLRLEITKSHF